MADYVIDLAGRLIDLEPDPIPRYKIMKQLLEYETDDSALAEAAEAAMSSEQVQVLVRQQSQVGSWGKRFFTRNKVVKNPAHTTETALIRLNAMAVDPSRQIMVKAIDYLEKLLDGRLIWPDKIDPALGNDEAMRLVVAARLSEIVPEHPYVVKYADTIIKILTAAFSAGYFDEGQMREASEDLLGLRLDSDCQICFSLYPLILLRDKVDYELEQRWMDHIFNKRRGIYLINNRSLNHLPLSFPSEESMRYINAMDILSWYPSAMSHLDNARDWLWDQLTGNGFWDFGLFGRDGLELPLSNSWRDPLCRQIDSTVRTLIILRRIQRTCGLRDSVCHFL